jgi:hypothetical protein
MRSWLFGLALVVAFWAGCGSTAAPTGAIGVTPAMYQPTTMTLTPVADGDAIDLTKPPQGGFVLFVGARVMGLSSGTVELRGRLIDPSTGKVEAEDRRTVEMMRSTDDATVWIPDLRSFINVANVPVCPSTSTVDRVDKPFQLEVQVTERATNRVGTAVRQVVPSCRQTDAPTQTLCQCECQANFTIGKCGM